MHASCPCISFPAHAHAQAELGTDYLDLVLLHYSSCWGSLCSELPAKVGAPLSPPPIEVGARESVVKEEVAKVFFVSIFKPAEKDVELEGRLGQAAT